MHHSAKSAQELACVDSSLNRQSGTQNTSDMHHAGAGQESAAVPVEGYLKKYTNDLTELARIGELDQVLCRGEEARRCIHILSRCTKRNAVLVGEPGVGKTAVVDAIAQRIVSGRVPQTFAECSILSLDIGRLMGGMVLLQVLGPCTCHHCVLIQGSKAQLLHLSIRNSNIEWKYSVLVQIVSCMDSLRRP